MTASRTSILGDARGAAIYVEFLIMVPLIALIYVSGNYVHRLGESQIAVQRQTRACAWAFAAGGCTSGASAACQLAGPAALGSAELDRMLGTGLASVVSPIPTLTPFFRRPAGHEVVANGKGTVDRPTAIGGSAETTGTQRMLCNDRPVAPQLPEVFDKTCKGLLGQGGRCQ